MAAVCKFLVRLLVYEEVDFFHTPFAFNIIVCVASHSALYVSEYGCVLDVCMLSCSVQCLCIYMCVHAHSHTHVCVYVYIGQAYLIFIHINTHTE